MTPAFTPWIPVLRALIAAGWDRSQYSDGFNAIEQVWRRGGTRNLQQITFNVSGAKVCIAPWTVETTELPEPVKAWAMLRRVGAFEPAPERLDWRRAAA